MGVATGVSHTKLLEAVGCPKVFLGDSFLVVAPKGISSTASSRTATELAALAWNASLSKLLERYPHCPGT